MERTDIPNNVRQLILRHIDSVQQVEILALLRREPGRAWTPVEISRTLHISPVACEEWLAHFAAASLADHGEDGYTHARSGPHVRAADELVDFYGRRRLAVVDSIYNKE
jgi:hypothetical protein